MYLDHFRLNELPFSITPNTAFACATRSHREALATLLLALEQGEGFIKISGEVGTGKTLACRKLLAMLSQHPERYATVYVPNPCLSPRTLLLSIALELKLSVQPEASEHELLAALTAGLLQFAQQHRRVVVCLDEAQAMPIATLESLRLLSNLETETAKLMHVVLFGQPELDAKLARHDLRQLAQRISFHYTLGRLTPDETEHYVLHRLQVAGSGGLSGPLFTPEVIRHLHRVTGGTPRMINIVAHKALLAAFGEGALRVGTKHISAAARDTPNAAGTLRGRLLRWLDALRWRWGMQS
jgi:MSHA biogenesis protein MshM